MKGLFIPEITAEMFRNGCLESIEELMADGEIYDIEYSPWIPVSERLPSDDEPYEVLCCDNHGEIMIGHPFIDDESDCGYSAENEGCFMYECIAWKPLPKPYEAGDKGRRMTNDEAKE